MVSIFGSEADGLTSKQVGETTTTILTYDFDSAVKFGGWVLAALTLLYSIYRNHVSDKRVKNAEAKLHAIESRGKAPYFVRSFEPFQQIYEDAEDGHTYSWSATQGNILCWYRKRVSEDMPDGTTVALALGNHGEAARRIKIETELKDCRFRQGRDPKF
jgi:hypothetical protein